MLGNKICRYPALCHEQGFCMKRIPIILFLLTVSCAAYGFSIYGGFGVPARGGASPQQVLNKLLDVTEIQLDTAETQEMLSYISNMSSSARGDVLFNLKHKTSPTYRAPAGVDKIQFLQNLLSNMNLRSSWYE